jgi:hypothetical protein
MLQKDQQKDQKMFSTVTFSVTALPRKGAGAAFRDDVANLRAEELEGCFLSAFHVGESFAMISGEIVQGEHTVSNGALALHLTRRLKAGRDLDFYVSIDRNGSQPSALS